MKWATCAACGGPVFQKVAVVTKARVRADGSVSPRWKVEGETTDPMNGMMLCDKIECDEEWAAPRAGREGAP